METGAAWAEEARTCIVRWGEFGRKGKQKKGFALCRKKAKKIVDFFSSVFHCCQENFLVSFFIFFIFFFSRSKNESFFSRIRNAAESFPAQTKRNRMRLLPRLLPTTAQEESCLSHLHLRRRRHRRRRVSKDKASTTTSFIAVALLLLCARCSAAVDTLPSTSSSSSARWDRKP